MGLEPPPRSVAHVATRGSAIKLGAELSSRALSLVTAILILRGLGVDGAGTFGPWMVVAVVLAEAADLGLQGTASQALVAGALSLWSLLRAKLLLSCGVLPLALVASGVAPVLAPLVLFFALAGWGEFLGVALRARGEPGREALLIFVLRASGLVAVAVAVALGPSPASMAWAHAASAVPPIGLGTWLLRRGRFAEGPDPGTRAVLRRSAPLAVNGGLALLSLRVELLAVKWLRGEWQAGIFLGALRVIEFLNMVPNAICAGAMPALTREAISGGGVVRRRTACSVALFAAPAAVGLALVAPGVVGLWGPEYGESARPLTVMAVAVLPLFLNALITHVLIAFGRPDRLPRLTALRVAVAATLAALLIPAFGPVGAAAGFVASECLWLVVGARACAAGGFAVPVLGPVALGVGAVLPMALIVGLLRLSLPVEVAAGVLTYAVTLGLGGWRLPRVWRYVTGAGA